MPLAIQIHLILLQQVSTNEIDCIYLGQWKAEFPSLGMGLGCAFLLFEMCAREYMYIFES